MTNLIKILSLILLSIFISTTLFAKNINSTKKRGSKNPAPNIQKDKNLKKESKVNNGELQFQDRDMDTGLYQSIYGVNEDGAYVSFVGHLNASYKDTLDVTTFEFIYGWHTTIGRIELSASRTEAVFDKISDFYNNDEPTIKDSILSFGIGYGYKSKMIQNLFNSEKIFDTTTVSIVYDSISENGLAKTFTGFGLKADFGIHSRVSKHMHYGIKLSYHLSAVKRSEDIEDEPIDDRAMMFSWTTMAFDLTFYF